MRMGCRLGYHRTNAPAPGSPVSSLQFGMDGQNVPRQGEKEAQIFFPPSFHPKTDLCETREGAARRGFGEPVIRAGGMGCPIEVNGGWGGEGAEDRWPPTGAPSLGSTTTTTINHHSPSTSPATSFSIEQSTAGAHHGSPHPPSPVFQLSMAAQLRKGRWDPSPELPA
ncbi:hypothetical protein HDU96_008817 [Phlyctochytrium bullatum]|nr:hypothetical protein HDU96_008817 [Phlyctochytrium bullatum]